SHSGIHGHRCGSASKPRKICNCGINYSLGFARFLCLSNDMADHRKFFRPRRLAFGGLPHACFLAISFALFSLARAEDAGLKNGATSLAAGKYEAAVRQFSGTINSDNAAPVEAAKALYLRGIAYRKLNQPSRAIADFGAAMWLGLPEGDRVKALVN